jgi:predicted enzyme related to lactoylglutathione lyase
MEQKMNPVGWFEIYVLDMKRAVDFYEKTLQVKLEKLPSDFPEMMAFPMEHHQPGCAGALVKMEGKSSGVGGTIIYFVCDDCAVESDRVAKNGGKVVKSKFSIGQWGFIALVNDSEGNMIGLHSRKYGSGSNPARRRWSWGAVRNVVSLLGALTSSGWLWPPARLASQRVPDQVKEKQRIITNIPARQPPWLG